jgi:hypothetical protein
MLSQTTKELTTDYTDTSLQSLLYYSAGTPRGWRADRVVGQFSARPFNPCWQSGGNDLLHRLIDRHADNFARLIF